MHIATWLRDIGLLQYQEAFHEHAIDMDVLPHLTSEDLSALGVTKVGDRRRLLEAITRLSLQNEVSQSTTMLQDGGSLSDRTLTERRHMTVMFYDLVDSTSLSVRLDPEDLSDIIRVYQRIAAASVERFGGYVARLLGDGGLVYFGYPQAHRDDPERAVRAALELLAGMGTIPAIAGHTPRARVGIATGLVVVGDIVGLGSTPEPDIAGQTPNLAARLQVAAEPGEVVICAVTERLARANISCVPLRPLNLKGFKEPVTAFAVRGLTSIEPANQKLTTLTPLIGRDVEMDLLINKWRQTREGEGHTILVCGEPGIGKSRIAAELSSRIADEPHSRLQFFCSPYHVNSVLFPVITQFEHAAKFSSRDPPHVKLEKLASMLRVPQQSEELLLIAEAMSLPVAMVPNTAEEGSQRRKALLLKALVKALERLASSIPLFVVVEDAHWIDATSGELLQILIGRVPALPVLILISLRPEVAGAWAGRRETTMITLGRLDQVASASLLRKIAGSTVLPTKLETEILERTDGIPLFIEEITKTILQHTPAPGQSGDPELLDHTVPESLNASLLERLDRQLPAKQVAQIASVIGRDFQYDLLSHVSDIPEHVLTKGLQSLTDSGLVYQKGLPPESNYRFKHALVRDAAYHTLLWRRRRELHGRVALTLEEHFPHIADSQPGIVAQHFAEAGQTEQAISRFEKAGRLAMARAALVESAGHLSHGLELLRQLPDSLARQGQEVALQLALGNAMVAAHGYAAAEIGSVYAHARRVCESLGDDASLIRAVTGQWSFHAMRGELTEALVVARELYERACDSESAKLLPTALRLMGASLFQSGELVAARQHFEAAGGQLAGLDKDSEAARMPEFRDTLIGVPAYLSICLALMGDYQLGSVQSRLAINGAKHLFRPHRYAFALSVAGLWFRSVLGEDIGEAVGELEALAGKQEFPYWHAFAIKYRGLMIASAGDFKGGFELLREADVKHLSMGAKWARSYFLGSIAQYADTETGLELVESALSLVATTGERWMLPELLRIKGVVLREAGCFSESEACLSQSIDTARNQCARHWEYRATTSLAITLRFGGKEAAAARLEEALPNALGQSGRGGPGGLMIKW
jgi:class 3 adenylate cyclase